MEQLPSLDILYGSDRRRRPHNMKLIEQYTFRIKWHRISNSPENVRTQGLVVYWTFTYVPSTSKISSSVSQ
jgi:hypothetical protein